MVGVRGQDDQVAGWFDIPVPLGARLASGADAWGTTVVFAGGGVGAGGEERVSLAELLDEATAVAAELQARGVAPRDHVAVFGLTSRPVVVAVLAVWLAGGAVAVLPIPLRLRDVGLLAVQARRQADAAAATLVVVDDGFGDLLRSAPGDAPVVTLSELSVAAGRGGASRFEAPAVDLYDLAVLQLTSGTTGDPKAVQVTHRQIAENHRRIVAAAGLEPGAEVAVSWLPLYHDMGLIGMLALPLAGAREVVLTSPDRFILSPASWMELVARHRGTVTAGPSFAYALAARALASSSLDLSSLRVAFDGGEAVAFAATEPFLAAAAAAGMARSALLPVYGMAEVTLMATCPRPGLTPLWDPIDTTVLRAEGRAVPVAEGPSARRLAVLGPPVEAMSLRIVGHDGTELAEREVGEIELQGPAVTAGYHGRADLTAAAFRDGWLRTGDRGYLADGSLVVCGRWKDMLIVGGRNIEPEEVEQAAERVEGIRPGNVAAFVLGEDGEPQRLVVVAEVRADRAGLGREVGRSVRSSVGAWPDEVVLVTPSTLPKTSSGKLRRDACRRSFLAGEL